MATLPPAGVFISGSMFIFSAPYLSYDRIHISFGSGNTPLLQAEVVEMCSFCFNFVFTIRDQVSFC